MRRRLRAPPDGAHPGFARGRHRTSPLSGPVPSVHGRRSTCSSRAPRSHSSTSTARGTRARRPVGQAGDRDVARVGRARAGNAAPPRLLHHLRPDHAGRVDRLHGERPQQLGRGRRALRSHRRGRDPQALAGDRRDRHHRRAVGAGRGSGAGAPGHRVRRPGLPARGGRGEDRPRGDGSRERPATRHAPARPGRVALRGHLRFRARPLVSQGVPGTDGGTGAHPHRPRRLLPDPSRRQQLQLPEPPQLQLPRV